MRRGIMWLLLICFMTIPQLPLAESAAKAEITGLRSAPFVDKALGIDVMRYVFDISQPIEAEGFVVVGGSAPQLAIVLKEAAPAKDVQLTVAADELVRQVKSTVNSAGTQVLLELTRKLTVSDFRVFILPGDRQANKTFRVVVDINRNPNTALPGKKVKPVVRGPQLLQLRSYTHVDAVTGANTLRVVLDSSVPVKAAATLSSAPLPRMLVEISGAAPGNIEREYELDGTIVDRAVIIPGSKDKSSRLVVDLPLMLEPDDYKLFTLPADKKADRPFRVVLDIKKKEPPQKFAFTSGLKKKVIVIDPGHGGSDPGAIGLAGLQEKSVNLAVALKAKELLQKAGAKVFLTRETDIDVYGPAATAVEELKSRTTIAHTQKADIFISIHSNASVNRTVSGTSTYFYQKTPYDALLAQSIQNELVQAGGLTDRRIHAANFYVVKRTMMPAALLELAFISNKDDEKLLGSPKFQEKMAQGIVRGIDKFFTQASKQGGEE